MCKVSFWTNIDKFNVYHICIYHNILHGCVPHMSFIHIWFLLENSYTCDIIYCGTHWHSLQIQPLWYTHARSLFHVIHFSLAIFIYSFNNKNIIIFFELFYKILGAYLVNPILLFFGFNILKKWQGHLFPKIILFPLPIFFSCHNGVLKCSSPYWFLYIFHDEIFNKASQEFVRQSVPGRIKLPADVLSSFITDSMLPALRHTLESVPCIVFCPGMYSYSSFSSLLLHLKVFAKISFSLCEF